MICGRSHHRYCWHYRLKNPWQKRGDTIEFKYTVEVPKSEAKAFTPEGDLLFLECGAPYITIQATMTAPVGYRIKVGDAPREELEKLVRLGVNGILSDLPEVMNKMLADMKKARGF